MPRNHRHQSNSGHPGNEGRCSTISKRPKQPGDIARKPLMKRLEEAQAQGPVSVDAAEVVLLDMEKWHVRTALDKATVERYREAAENGSYFVKPIVVGRCYGDEEVTVSTLCLIDGYHRMAAGAVSVSPFNGTLDAIVMDIVNLHEARYLSGYLNNKHGLPLKKENLVEMRKAYFEAKLHWKNPNVLKTLDEIGREWNISRSAVHQFVNKHFKNIARLYNKGSYDAPRNADGENRRNEGMKNSLELVGSCCKVLDDQLRWLPTGSPERAQADEFLKLLEKRIRNPRQAMKTPWNEAAMDIDGKYRRGNKEEDF